MLISSWLSNLRSVVSAGKSSFRQKTGQRRSAVRSGCSGAPQHSQRITEVLEDRVLLTTTLFSDTFESGTPLQASLWPSSAPAAKLAWVRSEDNPYWWNPGPLNAAGTYAATIFGDTDTSSRGMQSKLLDLAGYSSATISMKLQAEGNGYSPDSNEDLKIEYRVANGSWVTLLSVDQSSVSHSTFTAKSLSLPSNAFHSSFAFRIYATDLDFNFIDFTKERDHWFVDDVNVVGSRPPSISTTVPATGTDATDYTLSWSVSDPDADPISSVATQLLRGTTVVRSSTAVSGSLKVLKSDGPGTYKLSVVATDNTGATRSHMSSSLVVLDDDNSGPAVSLSGGGSLTDGQNQLFMWNTVDVSGIASRTVTVSQAGIGQIYSNTSDSSGSFDFNTFGPGTFTLSVSATDNDNDRSGDSTSSTSSITATVADDDTVAPEISVTGSSGTESAPADQRFTWYIVDLSGSTSDVVINKNGSPIFTKHNAANVSLGTFDLNAFGLGTYAITITATDDDSDQDGDRLSSTVSRFVNVVYPTPGADLVISTAPVLRVEGHEIQFDASGSFDPNGGTVTYLWDFGDGTTSTKLAPSHVYADDGNYIVTLTVFDRYGGSGTVSQVIEIANVAPSAIFSGLGTITEGNNSAVSFSSAVDPSSTDRAAGFRYAFDFDNNGTWDAGNGSYSGSLTAASVTVPSASLPSRGTYPVRGRILDKSGGYADYVTTITVVDDDVTGPQILLTGREGVTADSPTPFGWAISDASGLSQLSVTITHNSGSGPIVVYSTTDPANASGSFNLSQYELGDFLITVSATDADADRPGDGLTNSVTRSLSVVVPGANTTPAAVASSVILPDNGEAIITLAGSDAESAVALLNFTITSLPSLGELVAADGSVVEVGDQFMGSPATLAYRLRFAVGNAVDAFTFTVTDSGNPSTTIGNALTSGPATVTIHMPADSDGIVRVGGTNAADTIGIGTSEDGTTLLVEVNGEVQSDDVPLSSVRIAKVFGRDGDDSISFGEIPNRIEVDGGLGFDQITLDGIAFDSSIPLRLDGISSGGANAGFSGIDGIGFAGVFAVTAAAEARVSPCVGAYRVTLSTFARFRCLADQRRVLRSTTEPAGSARTVLTESTELMSSPDTAMTRSTWPTTPVQSSRCRQDFTARERTTS